MWRLMKKETSGLCLLKADKNGIKSPTNDFAVYQVKMMKNFTRKAITSMLALLGSGMVVAAGFDAQPTNASGLGVAYAGSAAVADNAAVQAANPAGIAHLDGLQLSTGLVVRNANLRVRSPGLANAGGDAGEHERLGNLALSVRVSPEISAGLSISTPYQWASRYDSAWSGANLAVRTTLRANTISPSVAYQLNDKVALGLGLNYQTIDLRMTQTAADFKADDSSIGWTAGALFTLSPAMRVGVAYRSGVRHDLSGRFNGASAKARLETPASLTLSVWQQVTEQWEAMGDLSYTRWRSVDAFPVRDKTTGNLLAIQGANLDDAWRLAWGAAYRISDQVKYKFGLAYERTATGNRQRTPQFPDSDSFWLSMGLQWRFSPQHWVDLGYAYRHQRDARLAVNAVPSKIKGHEHLLGLQYSAGF